MGPGLTEAELRLVNSHVLQDLCGQGVQVSAVVYMDDARASAIPVPAERTTSTEEDAYAAAHMIGIYNPEDGLGYIPPEDRR